MSRRIKDLITVLVFAVFIGGLSIAALISPDREISESERRKLAQFPAFTAQTVLSGEFTKKFDTYAADQFPFREAFRTIRAETVFNIFGQKDKDGLYEAEGYLSKLEAPLDEASIINAAEKFNKIYDKFLDKEGVSVYLSVIPDKNYFLAEKNGYLSMDYDALVRILCGRTPDMKYIDLFPYLELSDYYRTDTHWRQEKIGDAAFALLSEMGAADSGEKYEQMLSENPFFGVYYGQAALPAEAEKLYYLDSESFGRLTIFDYETSSLIGMYDHEKEFGKDPYEIFLSGPKSLISINDPDAITDRKLIVFRDSFGSSIAPLLTGNYSEIYLVDIRYLSSARLADFIEFENADVLFLYSTLVLNNSITLK